MISLMRQLLKFGIVGVICFGIDYGLMILLIELSGLDYLLSSGISFGVSVVVNYFLSMRFVFTSKEKNSKAKEFVIFVVLSVMGLLLTIVLMRLSVENLGFHYMQSKIVITGIVMAFNFVTRKVFLEQNQ